MIRQKDTKPSATPTWVDTAQCPLFQCATSPNPAQNPNLEVHQDHRWQPRGLGVLQGHVLASQQLLRTWGQVEEQTSSTGAAEYVPRAGAPAQSRVSPTMFRENTSEEPSPGRRYGFMPGQQVFAAQAAQAGMSTGAWAQLDNGQRKHPQPMVLMSCHSQELMLERARS